MPCVGLAVLIGSIQGYEANRQTGCERRFRLQRGESGRRSFQGQVASVFAVVGQAAAWLNFFRESGHHPPR